MGKEAKKKFKFKITPDAYKASSNIVILFRDAQARLTISSPLEAHKTNTIVFHTVQKKTFYFFRISTFSESELFYNFLC